ncbi:MAG: HaeII family restriction endonuclease, partial [Candidatus Gracilibacteria bacterium]
MKNTTALSALDKIIRKSRIHFYKPMQIAEILYRARTENDVDLSDIESYRNRSKIWRDQISSRLVGRVSTSSQKFQDNLFEDNAIPPAILLKLGELNDNGKIEKHIYLQMANRLADVSTASDYIGNMKHFK